MRINCKYTSQDQEVDDTEYHVLTDAQFSSQFFVWKASENWREAEENMRRAGIMMKIISKHATGHKYHDEDVITKACIGIRKQAVIVKYYSETQHNED